MEFVDRGWDVVEVIAWKNNTPAPDPEIDIAQNPFYFYKSR